MTPGQLIELLEKAGMLKEESPGVLGWHPTMQKAERFAALVRDHLLSTEIHSCHADCQRLACVQTRNAVEAEREACAQMAEAFHRHQYDFTGDLELHEAIRERGQQ